MNHLIEQVHISQIRVGDVIQVDGKHQTVCAKDMKVCPLMGTTLFGDSYRCGMTPVSRVVIPQFYRGQRIK